MHMTCTRSHGLPRRKWSKMIVTVTVGLQVVLNPHVSPAARIPLIFGPDVARGIPLI